MSYTPEPEQPAKSVAPGEPGLPGDESEPGKPKRPSNGRIAVWVGVAAVGLYFLGSGIYGIITGGH